MINLWKKRSDTLIVAGAVAVFALGAFLLLALSGTNNTNVAPRDLTEQPVNIYAQPLTCNTAILRSWWEQVDSRIDRYQDEMEVSGQSRDSDVHQVAVQELDIIGADVGRVVVPDCAPDVVVTEFEQAADSMTLYADEFDRWIANPDDYALDMPEIQGTTLPAAYDYTWDTMRDAEREIEGAVQELEQAATDDLNSG